MGRLLVCATQQRVYGTFEVVQPRQRHQPVVANITNLRLAESAENGWPNARSETKDYLPYVPNVVFMLPPVHSPNAQGRVTRAHVLSEYLPPFPSCSHRRRDLEQAVSEARNAGSRSTRIDRRF